MNASATLRSRLQHLEARKFGGGVVGFVAPLACDVAHDERDRTKLQVAELHRAGFDVVYVAHMPARAAAE